MELVVLSKSTNSVFIKKLNIVVYLNRNLMSIVEYQRSQTYQKAYDWKEIDRRNQTCCQRREGQKIKGRRIAKEGMYNVT